MITMDYNERWRHNCAIAVELGLSWVAVDEECSQFTPGAHWEYGSEIYVVPVYYAAPQATIDRLQDDGDDDAWMAYLMPDYIALLNAVPPLLAACERALNTAFAGDGGPAYMSIDTLLSVRDELRAAVAQARGE